MKMLLTSLALTATFTLQGKVVEQYVDYHDADTQFQGVLVYDDSIDEPAPAVLMVPNWMGVTPEAIEKAKLLAGDDYVFFIADMYGKDVRPANSQEAGKAVGVVKADRALQRQRAQLALDTLLAQQAPIDKTKTAAIGFCFGGGTVLELGRSGADLDAIVSFHGDLDSPLLSDAGQTKASVLVLHGADDPYVPASEVTAFIDAYKATDVDWQLVQFSGTVHSFTNPLADSPGKAAYNARSCHRAYEYMEELFEEKFGDKDDDE